VKERILKTLQGNTSGAIKEIGGKFWDG
jgi:hypothetical protein